MSPYLWLPLLHKLVPARTKSNEGSCREKELTSPNPSECLHTSDARVTYTPSYSSPEMEMLRAILGSFTYRIL
jgi:hypothetical protein